MATKKEIQKKLEEILGERWDFPYGTGKGGTSTTGNKMLPGRFQPIMTQIGHYLSVILRLFSSSKNIDVQEYKTCTTLYLLYLESFPTPTKPKKKSSQPVDLMWISSSNFTQTAGSLMGTH